MDSLITAAARALAAGDPLGALKRVALRDDAPALALRGIAMAQLGDLVKAKVLLRRAARAFGPKEAVSHARCVIAEAEVALVARDLGFPQRTLSAAAATLDHHGDRWNAAHARYLEIRRLLLIGRLDQAEQKLGKLNPALVAPALVAVHELVAAGIAIRRLRTGDARAALERAGRGLPAKRESPRYPRRWKAHRKPSTSPAARLIAGGRERVVRLDEVEALLASKALIVDACRYAVRDADAVVPLAARPVLFALAQTLGEAWPRDVPRDALIARAFGGRHADESHRARLRVEIGRLRKVLQAMAGINATKDGFALTPRRARQVLVLAQPVEDPNAAVLAFLADGESWSSSALALALGTSQRTVQRALDALAASGKVQSFGRARSRRWMTPPVPGFTTTLLLPAPLAGD